jgi:hypothetical protein
MGFCAPMSDDIPEDPDKAVKGFLYLIALALCCGSGDVIMNGAVGVGISGFLVALLVYLTGYHWLRLKEYISKEQRKTLLLAANDSRWWVTIAIVAVVAMIFSPFVEGKRWPFSAWLQTAPATILPESSDDTEDAVAPIREERDRAIKERDATRTQLESVTKDRNEQKQMIAALQTRLDSLRFGANTDMTQAVTATEPMMWTNRIFFYSDGDKKIKYIVMYGTNNGSMTEQLKTATLSSDITGETRSFSVEVPAHRIDAEQRQIQSINPIPPGAEIELIMEWNPTISVADFIGQWGRARLEIDYGITTHKKVFDHDNMASMLAQDIAGADSIVGAPRVTPKFP